MAITFSEDQTSPSSMALSVTRHAQNPDDNPCQFLCCGIDTLDLGLYVVWDSNWSNVRAALDAKKETSQGTKGSLDITEIGREFLHLPTGKAPNYRFHLQFKEYHLFLAKSDTFGTSPNVYVTILAEALWHVGISPLLELLEIDLDNFGGTIERIQPSRVDLCADFLLNRSPSFNFLERHRVSRTRATRMFQNNGDLETYYCGSPKSPVQVRIYDKTKEATKNNKLWFFPIWDVEPEANVWRVEFQLRRAFLKQYRVNTLPDLWEKIGAMWFYLAKEWFSLRLPDNDKAERRTLHPWWLAVQECRSRFGAMSDAQRTFTSDAVEPIQRALSHIIGRLISISAQSGVKDRKESVNQLAEMILAKIDDERFKEELQKKLIKLGYRGQLGGADHDDE